MNEFQKSLSAAKEKADAHRKALDAEAERRVMATMFPEPNRVGYDLAKQSDEGKNLLAGVRAMAASRVPVSDDELKAADAALSFDRERKAAADAKAARTIYDIDGRPVVAAKLRGGA